MKSSTLVLAAAMTLAPIAAFGAPTAATRHHHHHHHGHHSAHHHKTGHHHKGNHHKTNHPALERELARQTANLDALHATVSKSWLSKHDRSIVLHRISGLRHRIEHLRAKLDEVKTQKQLRHLKSSLHEAATDDTNERSVVRSLEEAGRLRSALDKADQRLNRDLTASGDEEEEQQMGALDRAITDLDNAQTALSSDVHILLTANPASPRGVRTSLHRSHRLVTVTAKDIRQANKELARAESR